MMLTRPHIDYKSETSFDVPFYVCVYHWEILNSSYRRYLISMSEAQSQAFWIAVACPDCETPLKGLTRP